MKQLLTIFALFCLSASMFAQSPNKISYQAVVRNSANALIVNQAITMKITIVQGNPTGAQLFTEKHNTTTNVNGLASIEIGTGTPIFGTFASIDWANGPYYLKTDTDPTGGTSYSITGITQMLSVPYALYAATAGTALNVPTTPSHYIGEEFQGGVIFHLWKDTAGTEHGLIVSKGDAATYNNWSNIISTNVPNNNAKSTWNGPANCTAIMAQTGFTAGAVLTCANYTSSGYSDWYLPSADELSLLWHNRFDVNKTLASIAPFGVLGFGFNYWSSTENNSSYAFSFNFLYGHLDSSQKGSNATVRAIRAF